MFPPTASTSLHVTESASPTSSGRQLRRTTAVLEPNTALHIYVVGHLLFAIVASTSMESSVLRAPHFGTELPILPSAKLILQHISDPLGDPKPLSTLSATNCPHIYRRWHINSKLHDLYGELCGCVWVQVDLQEMPPLEVYRGQFKLSLYLIFRLILGVSILSRGQADATV